MATGQLLVEFIASTAKYQEDLGKAAAQSEATARRIEASLNRTFDKLKSSVTGLAASLGVGFSIAGIEQMISGAIAAEAELERIGSRAGISGEEISKLSRAARLSRTDLSDLADMSAKLSKALLQSQESGSKQEAVLRALGFSGRDTARLLADPVNALFELSKSLKDLPEGGTKAAAMMLLLGRGGSAAAAALNELSKQTSLVAIRTNEEIRAAKEFEDKLSDMEARSNRLKTTLANALLPALSDTVDALTKLTTGAGGAQDGLNRLAADGSIKEWARDAILVLGTVAESLILIGRLAYAVTGSFKVVAADIKAGAASIAVSNAIQFGASPEEFKRLQDNEAAVLQERNQVLDRSNQNYEELWKKRGDILTDAIKKQFVLSDLLKQAEAGAFDDPRDRRNRVALEAQAADAAKAAAAKAKRVQDAVRDANRSAAGGAGEDPTKKILETQLKVLDASINEEKALLNAREDYLSAYYAAGDISIRDYYRGRDEAIAEGLAFQDRALGEEISKLRAFQASRDDLLRSGNRKDPGYASAAKDIEEAEKKIVEVTSRRTLAQQEASRLSIKAWFDERAAVRAATLAIESDLLELVGKTAEASRLRNAETARIDRAKFADNPDLLKQIDAIEKQKNAQAELNEVQTRYGLILDQISVKQSRIDLHQQTGQITEIEAINAKAAAARAQIADANDALVKFAATVSGMPDGPIKDRELLKVEEMRLAIERLGAQSDVLAAKFRDVFVGSVSNALIDLISGAKSAKEVFKDLERSISQGITQIASKNIAESLFKSGGPLGGISTGLAGLFGAKTPDVAGAVGTAGADAALTTLGATAGTADVALATLAASTGTVDTSFLTLDATALTIDTSFAAAALAASTLAVALNAAALASSVSSAGGYAAALQTAISAGGSYAGGGDPPTGKWSLVGEHGPEIIRPRSATNVIPNYILQELRASKGGTNVNAPITINVPSGADRRSGQQAGAEAAREMQHALARIR